MMIPPLSVARSGAYFATMSGRKKRSRSCALCSALSVAVSLGPVGLVVASVRGAQEQQDVEVTRSCGETDKLDRIATIGGLGGRLSALRLEREHARLEKRDRVPNLAELFVARDRRIDRWGDRIRNRRDRERCDRHGFCGRSLFL